MRETFLINTENTKAIKLKMDIFGCKRAFKCVYGMHCVTETQLTETEKYL